MAGKDREIMIAPKIHLTEARRIRRNSKFLVTFVSFVPLRLCVMLLAITLLSCQTAPKISDIFPDDAGYIPLDSGASVYITADVQSARPLLYFLDFIKINDEQFQQMLDQTQYAVAGIYAAQGVSRYQLTAWGSYPSSRAKIALGTNKDWKKQRSQITGDDYWYSAKDGISLAITAGRAFVSASAGNAAGTPPNIPPYTPTDPFSPAPGTAIPEGFNQFRKGAALSMWIDNPGPSINQKLLEMGIPLELPAEQAFVSLVRTDEQSPADEQLYEARLRIQVDSEIQARALVMVFAFARGFLSLSAASDSSAILGSILFANPPVQDGKSLIITTDPLSAREISLLFALFSLQ